MRSHTSSFSARRNRRLAERRTRRRPAILAAGLVVGLATAASFTATAPSQPEASGSSPSFSLASFAAPAQPAAEVPVTVREDISAHARDALAGAEASLAAATTITADIQSSGLDLGEADTSIDTAALEAAVQRLEGAAALPAPFIPALTDDVTSLVAAVDERAAGLRGGLEAAKARKAEEEAAVAEQARLEAEAAAAAAARSSSFAGTSAPPAPAPAPAPGGSGGSSPAAAQATARGMLGGYGWGDDQFSCLVSLWHKESGWRVEAYNRSSGATGIPQALPGSKMASAGADWQTNAATQISWGLGYISGRYGSPCGAWSHSQSVGWY